jgi:hypothetical protein
MHTSNETRSNERLLITTVSGRFDFGELEIDQLRQWGKGELDGYSLLMDIRQAEVELLSNADFMSYADKANAPVPPKCIAILVATDTQGELAQAYITASYTQKHYTPCRIFHQLDKALAWIEAAGK